MNIREQIDRIKDEGYSEANAEAKLCQDIVLQLISKSSLCRNCTIKGGVVMRSLSQNTRRATQDMDIDFIRYSLDETAIRHFVATLNDIGEISIKIIGDIEELRQQDYHGKRIHIEIEDGAGTKLTSKIDLGVHTKLNIKQDEYCFDIGFDDDGASLLINSKEQMLTEKLRSILKFGIFSTRFKDIYDMYYLFDKIDEEKFKQCLDEYIFKDEGMRENSLADILTRVKKTFANKRYLEKLATSKKNWLDLPNEKVLAGIIDKIQSLQ
jgi:predicted nucleotidyltransferase component of viral defense system